ncbi:MAG: PVC-type heme-binding CxxCH protein [Planctomycetota bacterium]
MNERSRFATRAFVALLLAVLPMDSRADVLTIDSSVRADYSKFPRDKSVAMPGPKPVDVDDRLRVAFLGGTLMEGESRDAFLETELTQIWADREIAFRNLGWAGDDVGGSARTGFGPGEYRRSGWQPPNERIGDYGYRRMLDQIYLAKPDIVFIAYGSTLAYETKNPDAAIDQFRKQLIRLLDALSTAKVRVVLISPPTREPVGSAGPKVSSQNAMLERASAAIQEIAARRKHLFVNAFSAFQSADRSEGRLSHNGVHLNAAGYRLFARTVSRAVAARRDWSLSISANGVAVLSTCTEMSTFRKSQYGLRFTVSDEQLPSLARASARVLKVHGLRPGSYALDIAGRRVARANAADWNQGVALDRGPDVDRSEQLRAAIQRKNRLHFYEFRPQNKAYIYLFRRHERGHHEGEVSQFAVLAKEADAEIAHLKRPLLRHYEIVRERDYPDHEVPGQKPVPNVAEELKKFRIADGFRVNAFASDPMISNPINVNWDARGRLWAATSTIYPHLAPGKLPNDRIIILEDIDEDGDADLSKVFADGLLVPQSVIPSKGGAYVAQSTEVLFLADHDGDDRADEHRVLFTGFGNSDVHHMIHGLRWGPGGDLYFTQSIYINSWIETPWGIRQLNGSGIWRLRPDSMRLEIHSRGLVNPWGHAFDRYGQSFSTDGAGGGGPSHTFAGSAFKTAKGARRTLRTLNPGRPKECGLDILSGSHVPESWRGDLITSDFRANRVVRYKLTENGSGYSSRLLGDVLSSSHRAFRPVDVKMGPDGAIYVVDWYSPIIDHGEVDFHHPLRDRHHGRIWRLTAKGRDFSDRARLDATDPNSLLVALKLPENDARGHARRLLRELGAERAVAPLRRWCRELDPASVDSERHRLEALWVFQGLRVPDIGCLSKVLASRDHQVRAAAVRVLGDWHSEVPNAAELFGAAIEDPSPVVRLAAVNALRDLELRDREAPKMSRESRAELVARALDSEVDASIDYAAWLSLRELEDAWLPRLQKGESIFGGKAHRLAFALAAAGTESALKPLITLVKSGQISGRGRDVAVDLIARLGSKEAIALVLEAAVTEEDSSKQQTILESLLAGASTGRATPPNASQLTNLLDPSDLGLLRVGVQLARAWRVNAARPNLKLIAVDPSFPPRIRGDACDALGQFPGGLDQLRALSRNDRPSPVRSSAVAARATLEIKAAARDAVEVLQSSPQEADAEALFEAFLRAKNGESELTRAVDGKKLPTKVAATGIRVAGSSGRATPKLIAALTSAGGLRPITRMPNSRELTKILTAIAKDGDPIRGEAIFRRESLRCTTCHAIGGAGGKVGPDLSSLGGSAQTVHLLEALLDPSAKIKEGYEPVVVIQKNGTSVSGTIAERRANGLRIRDAQNQAIDLPASKILAVEGGDVSIMPEGLTQELRRDELVDLVTYLSQLGRTPRFSLPVANYVRHWETLPSSNPTTPAQIDVMAKSARVFDWKPVYSRVDGSLPLEDIPTIAGKKRVVRFAIEATRRSQLKLAIDGNFELAVDGKVRGLSEEKTTTVSSGRHEAVLLLPSSAKSLRVELREAK